MWGGNLECQAANVHEGKSSQVHDSKTVVKETDSPVSISNIGRAGAYIDHVYARSFADPVKFLAWPGHRFSTSLSMQRPLTERSASLHFLDAQGQLQQRLHAVVIRPPKSAYECFKCRCLGFKVSVELQTLRYAHIVKQR